MYIIAQVKPSPIFGKGLFACEPVARGKIICFFPIGAQVITETRYLQAIEANERPIVRTGTRYAGKYFTIGNEAEPYTFLNHSFNPNLLCHCGTVLARRDIAAGEELTLDYRTLVDATDIGIYRDVSSGQEIRGLSAKQTLLATARELIAIVEGIEEWEG
ncbi:MAG TPA: SET domain-containing protein [Tepidisphaeraceae bacterium]|nr:SET domain-containing protein [Tepidisphaeraceae bacterium]